MTTTTPWPHLGERTRSCPDCPAVEVDGEVSHAAGCPIAAELDAMREADRTWFLDHPAADFYYRDLRAGDLSLASLESVFSADGRPLRVKVTQIRPGYRSRHIPPNVAVVIAGPDGTSLDGEYVAHIWAAVAAR